MVHTMNEARSEDPDLLKLQEAGVQPRSRDEALGLLLEKHRARLLRMVELRMDPGLKARLGASDVLQDAFMEIAGRIDAYLADPKMPFFVWARFITSQRLLKLYRFHAGAKKRDVRREAKGDPAATSASLIGYLMASGVTPSVVMAEGEFRTRMADALDTMNPLDREVLVLRHFEELTNVEAAQVLGIETSAASKRYLRALTRFTQVLREAGLGGSQAP